MRRPPTPALLLAVPALIAGCGNDHVRIDSLTPTPSPGKTARLAYPDAGLRLELPRGLPATPGRPPAVFRASAGEAFVSGFAYRRREQIPRDPAQVRAAQRRLVRAAQRRAKGLRLRESRTTRVAGAPAVELVGDQTISGGRLRTRSLHVYKGRAEYVIELLAPVAQFRRIDRAVFPTIRRTLRVTGKVAPAPRR